MLKQRIGVISVIALVAVLAAAWWLSSRASTDQPALIAQDLVEAVISGADLDSQTATLPDGDVQQIAEQLPQEAAVEAVSVSPVERADGAYTATVTVRTGQAERVTVILQLDQAASTWQAQLLEIVAPAP